MAELVPPSSATYLIFLNSLKDVVIATDGQPQIIFTNAKPESWFQQNGDIFLHLNPQAPHRLLDLHFRPLLSEELPLQRALRGESLQDLELLITTANPPDNIWVSVSGGPLPEAGAIIAVREISARKQTEADLLHHALYDELTNLPNRNLFMDRVNRALARSRLRQSPLMAILFIDLDRFKAVNDHLGYSIGNQLLREMGERLKANIRPEDTVARLGGDEFAVLLEEVTACSVAIEVAERLRHTITQPFHLQQQELHIEASIGIAFGTTGYLHPEDWLRDANTAMYQIKDTPDVGWQVFDSSLQVQQDQRLQIEMDLRQAIPNGELLLHYQPIVAIHTQDVIGFEALVRWQHPEQGLLMPGDFISLAETTGLIIPLGWWVLREACRQMQVWTLEIPATRQLTISVNMSSKQFSQKFLVEKLQQVLQETGFSPTRLTLEITESVLIDHSESIISTLKQLQEIGIKLSIDDFGTGYSSLSYLHRFPFDTIKIDRSFIENADQDFEKLEILQSVVRLAWNLGLDVVAEGVETQKHYAQLKALRCESGQGFLFARPLPPAAAKALILEQFQPPE